MRQFLIEQPIIAPNGEPMRALARQVAAWINGQERGAAASGVSAPPSPRGCVAGLYGGRGSGKTSFLFTLLEELRQPDALQPRASAPEPPAAPVRLVLPTLNQERGPAIFKPAETRAQDGLLLLLLDHLDRHYPRAGAPQNEGAVGDSRAENVLKKRLQKTEVLTKKTDLFLAYAREVAPSSDRLEECYVEVLTKAATTTLTLREQFKELLTHFIPDGSRLVLLIDDVDLQPHRALELLELLHLFLDRPDVFIVLAADKALLLEAIDGELQRRDVHHPGLAAALLAKYVPYSWRLAPPVLDVVAEKLKESLGPQPESAASPPPFLWWDEAQLRKLLPLADQNVALRQDDGSTSLGVEPTATLRALQPTTYRELNALVNLLRAWRMRLGEADAEDGLQSIRLHEAIDARYNGREKLGLLRELAPAFLVLLASVDVRWPDLGVLEALELEPDRLVGALSELVAVKGLESAASLRELPVTSALFDERRFSPERRGQAKAALVRLGEVLARWRNVNASAGSVNRFLFVTMRGDADAVGTFQDLWIRRMTKAEAGRTHLDLRGVAGAEKPTGGEVEAARREAEKQLVGLIGTEGRLWVCAMAPLSLLAWLGFAIDHRRPIVACNADTLRAVEVPKRLRAPARASYEKCVMEWDGDAQWAREAHVILDFLGTSTPGDTHHERWGDAARREGEPSREERGARDDALGDDPLSSFRGRLIYPGSDGFNFGDLEEILLEVLELITELREREVRTLHLGLNMPDVVAFSLGRQLRSRGMAIILYERLGDRYERAIVLEA